MAEFITRFLKGGVFEIGGLYAWACEIKAKLYGNTNPDEIKPLLWVYRECLKRGLMTKQEMIDWADWIIATETEPHHLFIDLSLSRDVNELITILDSIHLNDGALQIRALFGTIDTRLLIDKIPTGQAISILESFWRDERLTTFERNRMIALIVESDDSRRNSKLSKRLHEKVKDFFYNYKGFNLYHFRNWDNINAGLVEKFESKNVQ